MTEQLADHENPEQEELSLLWVALGVSYQWRRFIISTTSIFAILAVIISLLLPNWYASEARLLSPEGSATNPLSAALSSNLSAAASAILGRPGGDYFRYITILTSRSMMERVVDEFDLITVYETQDALDPKGSAMGTLADNASFPIDNEYDFLSVQVMDRDPALAADMANFFVQELNRRNQELAAQDAAHYRSFVENRYQEALATIDSLKNVSQRFQQDNGLFNLEEQASTFLEYIASLRAQEVALEIDYQALLQQYGSSNSRVKTAQNAFNTAKRKGDEAFQGREAILPISQAEFPAVMRTYIDLQQDLLVQKSILDVIAPMYEQAKFQETREYEAVQVIDYAIPATRKAKPKRSVIVIAATLSAFILVMLFVFAYEWWQRSYAMVMRNLDQARLKN